MMILILEVLMSREHLLKKPFKNRFLRSLLLCLLSFLVFNLMSIFYGVEAFAGQATLSWGSAIHK